MAGYDRRRGGPQRRVYEVGQPVRVDGVDAGAAAPAAVRASSREAPAQDGQATGRAHQHVGVIEQVAGGYGARRQPLQPVRVRRPAVRGEQSAGYVDDGQRSSGMAAPDQYGHLDD